MRWYNRRRANQVSAHEDQAAKMVLILHKRPHFPQIWYISRLEKVLKSFWPFMQALQLAKTQIQTWDLFYASSGKSHCIHQAPSSNSLQIFMLLPPSTTRGKTWVTIEFVTPTCRPPQNLKTFRRAFYLDICNKKSVSDDMGMPVACDGSSGTWQHSLTGG